MSATSKSTLEKDDRVKTVRESDRSSKRRYPSNSDVTEKTTKLDSSTSRTDAKNHKEKRSEQKSPSRREKRQSSSRSHENVSERKKEARKRARSRSPTKSNAGSSRSTLSESSRNNNSSQRSDRDTRGRSSRSANGASTRQSFKDSLKRATRQEKDLDRKKEKRARSPDNSQSITRSSKPPKPSESSHESKASKSDRKELSSDGSDRGKNRERSPRPTSPASPRDASRHRNIPPKAASPRCQVAAPKEVESLKELLPAVITRNSLVRLIYSPYFKRTVVGCFVRMALHATVGNDLKYQIWKIIDVEELATVYKVEDQPTKFYIKCQHGTEEKLVRIKFASNSAIHLNEFDDWLISHTSIGAVPAVDAILKKKADIYKTMTYVYDMNEITMMNKAKKNLEKELVSCASNKEELYKRKEIAVKSGDFQDANQIQQCIDKLGCAGDGGDQKNTNASSAMAHGENVLPGMKDEVTNESVSKPLIHPAWLSKNTKPQIFIFPDVDLNVVKNKLKEEKASIKVETKDVKSDASAKIKVFSVSSVTGTAGLAPRRNKYATKSSTD